MFNVPADKRLNEAIANRLCKQLMNTRPSSSSGYRQATPRRHRESVALPVFVEEDPTEDPPSEVFP